MLKSTDTGDDFIEVMSFCLRCGVEIDTERQKRSRRCADCIKRKVDRWIVRDDRIFSIENMYNRIAFDSERAILMNERSDT